MNPSLRPVFLLAAFWLMSFGSCTQQPTKESAVELPDRANGQPEENGVERPAEKLPNIIFYLADDQDIYDYGCYGNDKVQTPAVDRLAREGMIFQHAFTGQAICAPSRSQLFSGKYPLKNGCFKNHSPSKRDLKSVTTYMRELGYEVILAGKSHVNPSEVYDWDQVFESVEKQGTPRKHIPIDSIRSYFSSSTQPFCMFITSYYPHGEYFDDDSREAGDIQFFPFNAEEKYNPAYVRKKSGYYRSILEDNKDLNHVIDLVDQYLDDNTMFFYSADHGVSGKFTLYDRGLNVPFIVRWPSVIKAGSKSEVLIHYTDVLPTLIDIVGGSKEEELDGTSFLPVLEGGHQEINEYVYGVQTNQNIIAAAVFPSRMIRNKKFKYIRNFNSLEVVDQNLGSRSHVNAFIYMGAMKFEDLPFEELYDIENDPFEQNNLANMPAFQQIKEKLVADMFEWMKEQGDFLPEQPGFMPIIKADHFPLDQEKRGRKIPDSLKNTLTREDYYYLAFEKEN